MDIIINVVALPAQYPYQYGLLLYRFISFQHDIAVNYWVQILHMRSSSRYPCRPIVWCFLSSNLCELFMCAVYGHISLITIPPIPPPTTQYHINELLMLCSQKSVYKVAVSSQHWLLMDGHDLCTHKIKTADSAHMGMLPDITEPFSLAHWPGYRTIHGGCGGIVRGLLSLSFSLS